MSKARDDNGKGNFDRRKGADGPVPYLKGVIHL